MQARESLILRRSCVAMAVPSGEKVVLVGATLVELVQALGGSFTVKVRGRLFRIDGKEADALGKEVVVPPPPPANVSDEDLERMVWDRLRTCFDPEIPINIVDLGLVYKCEIAKNAGGTHRATIEMTLTAPACGMGSVLVADVRQRIMEITSLEEVQVDLVFDAPWEASRMSEEARLETDMY